MAEKKQNSLKVHETQKQASPRTLVFFVYETHDPTCITAKINSKTEMEHIYHLAYC